VRKGLWRYAVPALAGAAALAWWALAGTPQTGAPAGSEAATQARIGDTGNPAAADANGAVGHYSATGLANRKQQLELWQERYARATQVYNSYRDATRYPPESRPLMEHPDQVRPFEPVSEVIAARDASGKPIKGLSLRTTQDRVFMGGNESVVFTIAALNDRNEPIAMLISDAAAQSIPDTAAPITPIQTSIAFNDNGTGGDAVAFNGTYSARFTPANQGFASHAGTVRVLAQVSANGERGVVQFDVVYAPEVPATWLGVRDVVEGGSLSFYLKIQAKMAGQYVASARVFDANNQPLALLQFNNTVAAGAQELKMQLFGALIRDKTPAFPLRLVDVDGFLLKPDTFPDRLMMARQPGVVHTTGSYAISRFSSAEWASEERERYLKEYGRDEQEAAEQLRALQGP
jgi:hypothetical protein